MSSNPITSVSALPHPPASPPISDSLPAILTLDLRGQRLHVPRDTLTNLPESLLVVMFPNGLVFGPTSATHRVFFDDSEDFSWDDDVAYVDFDAGMLKYVLKFYDPATAGVWEDASTLDEESMMPGVSIWSNPFPGKRAYIVLREELDYYPIPPTDLPERYLAAKGRENPSPPASPTSIDLTQATNVSVLASMELKRLCGAYLLRRGRVFDALRRGQARVVAARAEARAEREEARRKRLERSQSRSPDVHKQRPLTGNTDAIGSDLGSDPAEYDDSRYYEDDDFMDEDEEGGDAEEEGTSADEVPLSTRPNTAASAPGTSPTAEQQLIDMLCLAGFRLSSRWGYRVREPGRCSLTSISLVPLLGGRGRGTSAQMAAAQKLLLFWRKPARKCWWDGVVAQMKGLSAKDDEYCPVRLWSRRTWTLELTLV